MLSISESWWNTLKLIRATADNINHLSPPPGPPVEFAFWRQTKICVWKLSSFFCSHFRHLCPSWLNGHLNNWFPKLQNVLRCRRTSALVCYIQCIQNYRTSRAAVHNGTIRSRAIIMSEKAKLVKISRGNWCSVQFSLVAKTIWEGPRGQRVVFNVLFRSGISKTLFILTSEDDRASARMSEQPWS